MVRYLDEFVVAAVAVAAVEAKYFEVGNMMVVEIAEMMVVGAEMLASFAAVLVSAAVALIIVLSFVVVESIVEVHEDSEPIGLFVRWVDMKCLTSKIIKRKR